MSMDTAPRRHLMFYLNNELVVIKKPDPKLTLATYLREHRGLTGTKIGCGEGGCGACTVVLTWNDANSGKPVTSAVNACLRPLAACDSMAITTVEGLGCQKKGFNDVQTAIADGNGLQCGFCTPGWVTNYSGFIAASKAAGEPMTDADIETQADGNLCRCTGYRPILDAMKSLIKKSKGCTRECGKACSPEEAASCSAHNLNVGDVIPDFEDICDTVALPLALRKAKPSSVLFATEEGRGPSWFRPVTMKQLVDFAQTSPLPLTPIVGHTARAVAKYYKLESSPSFTVGGLSQFDEEPVVLVDINFIPEMKAISSDAVNGIVVGGAVTLSYLYQTIFDAAKTYGGAAYDALRRHFPKIATHQIRHAAGWAGNLMLNATHPTFPSDLVVCMITMGATVDAIMQGNLCTNISIDHFLEYVHDLINSSVASSSIKDECPVPVSMPILTSLHIPAPGNKGIVSTYKIMRRHCNSHPIVNAGFNVNFQGN
jgi:xanthine dehydrogenase/oxidase